MHFQNGDIVIATALNHSPLYRHHAVYLDGIMYHLSETGTHTDTPKGFLSGRKLVDILHCTQTPEQMHAYAKKAKNRRYNAVFFNCEHYAYEMATGKPKSPTIRGAVLFFLVLVSFVIYRLLNK